MCRYDPVSSTNGNFSVPISSNSRSQYGRGADELLPLIRQLDESFFREVKHLWVVKSPGGGKMAVCGEVRSWFGMKVRFFGFLLRAREEYQIIGKGVLGYRDWQEWQRKKELIFRQSESSRIPALLARPAHFERQDQTQPARSGSDGRS